MDVIDPRTIRVRRTLEGACLALAGALLAVGFAIGRSYDSTAEEVAGIADDRTQFLVSNLVIVAAALLFVPGAIGIAQLVRGRGSGLLTTGAAMIGIGGMSLALGLWSYTAAGRLLTTEPVPRDVAVRVVDLAYDDLPIGLVWLVGMGIMVGPVVCGIAFLRVRVVPRWLAFLLIAGPVVAVLGGNPGGLVTFAATLPLAVALAALGVFVARLPEPAVPVGVPAQGGRVGGHRAAAARGGRARGGRARGGRAHGGRAEHVGLSRSPGAASSVRSCRCPRRCPPCARTGPARCAWPRTRTTSSTAPRPPSPAGPRRASR